MTQTFTIPGRLPGYNDLTKGHWTERRDVKQYGMDMVTTYAKMAGITPVDGRVTVRVQCYELNLKRDQDNVRSGAEKCVLDALKNMGIIKGDGWKYVETIPTIPRLDRASPRVEVEITETGAG